MGAVKICTRCVLPETFAGIRFDEHGVCNYCQQIPSIEELSEIRTRLHEEMVGMINNVRNNQSYDCVVAFSGGKDSSYTLMMLVQELELNCIAVMIDNGFISNRAVKNCKSITSALGVDFAIFTPAPAFMTHMYKQSVIHQNIHVKSAIKRASNMCNSCISLINNHMIKTALQYNAPIIAGGYIGGQVPKDAATLRLDLLVQAKTRGVNYSKYLFHFGQQSHKYFGIDQSIIENSGNYKMILINPMLTVTVTEEEIIKSISALGWKPPGDTGKNSSNCLLNDLGIALHNKQYGFNPYVQEIAEQVRYGLMSRDKGLEKANAIPEFSQLTYQMDKLGLNVEEV